MEADADLLFPNKTTVKAIVESAFRYRSLVFQIVLGIMVLVVLYVLLAPRQYTSEMNILVRNSRPNYQITPERSNGSTPQADVTEELINSEIEVLLSRDVADKVVDPAWSPSAENGGSAARIKAHEKAVTKLIGHLSVELLRKSNVIHVVYSARSPQAATATVEKLLAAFLVRQHDLERSSGASSFFASEQERYKRELDDAQQQLADYQQAHQVVSLPDKESSLEEQIVDLEQQLRTTDVLHTELANRLSSGQAQLLVLPQRQIMEQKRVPNILAMEQLGTMLATYRNQRTALLTKFLPNDRLVLEADQQIANTSEALRQATQVNPSEDSTDVNPVWQQVKSAVSQNAIDLGAASARRAGQAAQLATLRALLVATEQATVNFSTLEARVTELQGNYQLYTQKRDEAQIANAMDQQQLVNVAIAESPTFSATPSSPRVAVDLALGGFAAIFFATCAVFFAEMGRDTIASPAELEALTRARVLATVPFLDAGQVRLADSLLAGAGAYSRPVRSRVRSAPASGVVSSGATGFQPNGRQVR